MASTLRRRISVAKIVPNRFHQNRTVSCVMSMPRGPSFLGKLVGLFGSIALVPHLAEHHHSPPLTPVSRETTERAAKIVRDFILPHTYEFDRSTGTTTDGDRLQEIASWILTSGKPRFVPSDFTTNVAVLRAIGIFDLNKALSPMIAGRWLTRGEPGPLARSWSLAQGVQAHFAARAAEEEIRKQRLSDLMGGKKKKAS